MKKEPLAKGKARAKRQSPVPSSHGKTKHAAKPAQSEDSDRYRSLFEDSPISLWEEDFSQVKVYLDSLQDSGVNNLSQHLRENTETLRKCTQLIKIVDVNRTTLELFKARNKEELIGNLSKLIPDESLEIIRSELLAIVEGNLPFETEITGLDLEGEDVHVAFQLNVAPGHEATWGRVFVSCINIQRRTLAEEALRKSEERNRALLKAMPDLIFVCNQQGDYVDLAAESEDGLVAPKEEMIGRNMRNFGYSEETLNLFLSIISKALETQEIQTFEFELNEPKKLGFWESRAVAISDEEVLFITRDINERKEAERQLRENELRYRSLFENAPIPLWEEDYSEVKKYIGNLKKKQNITDFRRYFDTHPEEIRKCLGLVRIVDVNRVTLKLYGAESKEDFSKGLSQLISEETLQFLKEELIALAEGKLQFNHETIGQTLKGEELHAHLYYSVAPGYEETWGKVFISIIDITASKAAEREHDKLVAKLAQAKRLETIGTLAGGIAHDFNNILQAIRGYVEIAIEDTPPNSRISDDFNRILGATDRGKNLIDQILLFSRRRHDHYKEISISELFVSTIDYVESTTPVGIELKFSIELDHDRVIADSTQIQQVLINLCSNAIHAMRDEGGVLEAILDITKISSENQNAYGSLMPGKYARITISDTGHGMSASTKERVFEPFFTTKEVGQGYGLGLSVVHGIITDHKGEITLESEPDKGTTFHVYLPLAPEGA